MKHFPQLVGRKDVVIDTMFFIYLFEDCPKYGELCDVILGMLSAGSFSALITPVTAAEIIVKPLSAGRSDLADLYISALHDIKNARQAVVRVDIGQLAGALRAKYNLPLPDMFQVAVAMQAEKPSIITNDKALKRVSEVEVFLLDEA